MPAVGPDRRRLSGLDGLRGVSVLLVLFLHLTVNSDAKPLPLFDAVFQHGDFGVSIFFAISGFLITYLLVIEERKTGAISLTRFYIRRSLRILPPAYLYLALISVLSIASIISVTSGEVVASAAFVRNLWTGGSDYTGHYWTLAIEEQFYIAWPLILICVPASRRIPLVAFAWAICPLYRYANIKLWGVESINWWRTDLRYDEILAGALTALLWCHPSWRARIDRLVRSGDLLFATMVAGIVVSFWLEPYVRPGIASLFVPVRSVCVCVGILVLVSSTSRITDRIMNARPLVWIGTISYSLYLWQQVVTYYPFEARWYTPALRFTLAIAAGALGYYLAEMPVARARAAFASVR